MLRKLVPLMIALLALGLLAGCGGGEEAANDAPAQQEATATPEASPAPETTAEAQNEASDQVQAAIERCKQTVQTQPQLSDDTKAQLEDTCEKAGSGDAQAAQRAAAEVCRKVIEDTVPAGAARDAALESCKTAGQ